VNRYRKGEIYDVAPDDGDSRPYRVVIVSSDEWNQGVAPQCVEIVRLHNEREIPPYLILLHEEADSMRGLAIMDSLSPVPTLSMIEQVGMVGGVTLSKLDDALRKVYAI